MHRQAPPPSPVSFSRFDEKMKIFNLFLSFLTLCLCSCPIYQSHYLRLLLFIQSFNRLLDQSQDRKHKNISENKTLKEFITAILTQSCDMSWNTSLHTWAPSDSCHTCLVLVISSLRVNTRWFSFRAGLSNSGPRGPLFRRF